MKVDKELIEKIATLARLKLNKEEVEEFMPQFEEILKMFSELDKIDTKDAQLAIQSLDIKNVWREDKVDKKLCLSQKEALRSTKHKENGFFKGPKITLE